MEYVPGVPITAYCDAHALTIAARLELFQQVCAAVQHAHHKGIIHRDLKPSNVLVMQQDGRAIAKVIDFGLAKALNTPFDDHAGATHPGVFVGTLGYMSPEQAGAPVGSVDTRTDIYSLGVILYELLAGVRPFEDRDLPEAVAAELLRRVREVEPTPLTTRIRALSEVAASEIARRRQFNIRSLSRELRGELEWITRRCLEKEPARRYVSASELAADIAQYLRQEPISAGPPRLSYRLGKLVRKYPSAFAGMAVALVALVTGLAVSLVLYRRANEVTELSLWQSYAANIAAADLAIHSGWAHEAQRRLAHAPPALRRWEWHHLSLVADSSMSRYEKAAKILPSVTFDPTARQIIGRVDVRIFMVDERSRQGPSRPEPLPGSKVDSHAYWKGSDLSSVDHTWAARLRSLESGTPLARIGDLQPRFVLFSPDGTRVLAAVDEHVRPGKETHARSARGLHVVDGQTAAAIARIDWPEELDESTGLASYDLAFSPDGRRVALCGGSRLYVWDASTSQVLLEKTAPYRDRLEWLTYTAGGTKIVCIGQSGTYVEWEAATGRMLASHLLPRHGRPAAMTRDGSRIAWIARERIVISDVAGTVVMTLLGHTQPISALAYSADGSALVSAASDGLRVWKAGTDRVLSRLQASAVTSLAFHPTRSVLVAADGTHGLEYWNLDSSRQVALQSWHRSALVSASLSRDGSTVISGDERGTIHRWTFGGSQPALTIDENPTSESRVTALAIDADDLSVFTARQGRPIQVWSGVTGRLVARVGDASDPVHCLAASADYLVAGTASGHVLVWRRHDWTLLHRVQGHRGAVEAVSISRDGGRFASGGRDSIIRLWDTRRLETSDPLGGS